MPLLFGATMVMMMLTWRRGTGILAQQDAAHRSAD